MPALARLSAPLACRWRAADVLLTYNSALLPGDPRPVYPVPPRVWTDMQLEGALVKSGERERTLGGNFMQLLSQCALLPTLPPYPTTYPEPTHHLPTTYTKAQA